MMLAKLVPLLVILAAVFLAVVISSNKYKVTLKIWDNTDCSGDPIEDETVSEGYCIVCDGCGSEAYRVTCSNGGDTVSLNSYDNDECTNADNTYDFTDSGGDCLNNGPGFSFEINCKKDDDDDEDNVCFHGDETVTLQSGASKRLADVKVGDSIQVMRADATLGFSDVVFMPHKANMETASFVQVETDTQRSLKLTPEHLILSGSCSTDAAVTVAAELVRAKDLLVGSCVRTVDGEDKISRITTVKDRGIYTAVTADMHGHIVVNGVVASSFGTNHFVPNMYYNVHRALYAVLPQWIMESDTVKASNMLIGGFFISASAPFRK